VATVAAHNLHVPVGLAIAIALLIASVKASLVALVFMHLKGEVRAVLWTLMLTGLFFLALIVIPLSWYLDGPGYTHLATPAAHSTTSHGAH
jgi:caa(3)-type oxidase subunit IV